MRQSCGITCWPENASCCLEKRGKAERDQKMPRVALRKRGRQRETRNASCRLEKRGKAERDQKMPHVALRKRGRQRRTRSRKQGWHQHSNHSFGVSKDLSNCNGAHCRVIHIFFWDIILSLCIVGCTF